MDKYLLPPSFVTVARFIIDEIERGHVNDSADHGGETKYGISQRTYPQLDITSLTVEDALQIYWRDYWLAAGCDQLPVRMATFVFDGAINHRRLPNGGFIGVKLLQQALGVTADGVLGPQSLTRAWQAKDQRDVLPRAFAKRAELYHAITLSNSTQEKFLEGWMYRLFVLQQFINSIVTDPKAVRP